jgi:hypothetical protein
MPSLMSTSSKTESKSSDDSVSHPSTQLLNFFIILIVCLD